MTMWPRPYCSWATLLGGYTAEFDGVPESILPFLDFP